MVVVRKDLGSAGHLSAQAAHAAAEICLRNGELLSRRGWANGIVVVVAVPDAAALAKLRDLTRAFLQADEWAEFQEDDGRGLTAIAMLADAVTHSEVMRAIGKLPLL